MRVASVMFDLPFAFMEHHKVLVAVHGLLSMAPPSPLNYRGTKFVPFLTSVSLVRFARHATALKVPPLVSAGQVLLTAPPRRLSFEKNITEGKNGTSTRLGR